MYAPDVLAEPISPPLVLSPLPFSFPLDVFFFLGVAFASPPVAVECVLYALCSMLYALCAIDTARKENAISRHGISP